MILPFSTQFKDGTSTNFVNKIWQGLYMIPSEDSDWVRFIGRFWATNKQRLKELGFENVLHLSPAKQHTIREDIHDRWHEGSLIHPVVFNRSKNQFQFAPTLVCKSVQKIEIYTYSETVRIDGRELSYPEIVQLSKNDGFESIHKFWDWFYPDFKGKIIHWTDIKY